MRKILLILLIFILFPFNVMASVNTCTRTSDNLYVPDKIKYKDGMKSSVLSTPCVDANEKIYDFAEILTNEEEINLYNEVTDFINKTGLDLGIVTINVNNKGSAMVFADDFYDYNDFSRNGILLLIDMDTREYYFSTTGEAIFYFSDYRVDAVLDVMEYDMVNGDYNGAALEFVSQVEIYYSAGIVTDKYTIDSNGKIVRKTPWILLVIISLVVAFITTTILKGRNKKVKVLNHANEYLNGKLKLTKKEDIYLYKNTTKHYSPVSSSSGGSSSSSGRGISSHSGSSGTSHGGGGRKF